MGKHSRKVLGLGTAGKAHRPDEFDGHLYVKLTLGFSSLLSPAQSCRYFLSRLKKVKKANGQILACNEVRFTSPVAVRVTLERGWKQGKWKPSLFWGTVKKFIGKRHLVIPSRSLFARITTTAVFPSVAVFLSAPENVRAAMWDFGSFLHGGFGLVRVGERFYLMFPKAC